MYELEIFHRSERLFYFTLDHVMYDPSFVNQWKQQHQETFIPQACFMGFKSSCMRTFFELWKNAWKMWIEPKPFAMYHDSNPDFIGSAFCIEQYVLGNAVYNFTVQEALSRNCARHPNDFIFSIERKLILIDINEGLQAFYPSSKLQSMIYRSTSVSSLRYWYSLNINSLMRISNWSRYDSRISAFISNKYSTVFVSGPISNFESFIDSFLQSKLLSWL